MDLGFVFFVFLPSMVTTLLAGGRSLGSERGRDLGLAGARRLRPAADAVPDLAAVLAGMVLVGVGTFFAQAVATGFVGRAATIAA